MTGCAENSGVPSERRSFTSVIRFSAACAPSSSHVQTKSSKSNFAVLCGGSCAMDTCYGDSFAWPPSRRGWAEPFGGFCVIIPVMRRGTLVGLAMSAFTLASFTATAAAGGLPSRPIKVRVTLVQHRAVAGQAILGTVVLTNTTPRAITVGTCATDGWLAVGLSGRVDSYPFGHFMVGCAPTVRLAPGANRFSVTVITTYAGCVQPEPAGGSSPTPLVPWCALAGLPPLPGGRYVTKVDLVGLSGLTQRPNRVVLRLTSPKNPPSLAPCADRGAALPPVTVPNVDGMSSLAAASVLAKVCLNAGYSSPVGSSVISEMPVAGSEVPEHSTVTLATR